MERIKASQEVVGFIKAYADNVGQYSGWKDDLIFEHSRAWSNGFEDESLKPEAKCMSTISPFELSEILVEGDY